MRKITFFVLALFCAVASWAQGTVKVLDTDAENLITSADQITSPCSESSEGSIEALLDGDPASFWHSAWQGDASKWAVGTHYFQVEIAGLPDDLGFEFTRRDNSGNQIIKWGVYGAPSADAAKEQCTLLAEVETPFGSQTETLTSQVFARQGFDILRFYNLQTTSGSVFFHLAEFRLLPCKEADELEVAVYDLQAIYDTYTAKALNPEDLGDKPGKYGEAAYAAFEKVMEYANEICQAGTDCGLSVEQVAAAGEAIKEAWAAVEASRVPWQQEIKPGYYVIKSALDFYENVTIPGGTDDATGETVPETTKKVYYEKAIYADGTTPKWKTFEPKAAFLFKIEESATPRAYVVKNMLDNLTWNTLTSFTAEETDTTMMFDWSMENISMFADSTVQKVIPMVYNIRFSGASDVKSNTGTFVHAGGHGGGTGKSGNIVNWSCSRDPENSPCATDWYLEEIDEATALAWIEAASPVKKYQAMIDSVNVIKNAFPAQKAIAVDKVSELDRENPLITSASQFSSPFTTLDGQDTTEEQIFANLINEEGTTYWHSRWEDGNANPGTHYLEVADIPADAANVAFEITRRPVDNDHPAVLSVYGFDDHNAELTKEEGTLLATCRVGDTSNNETKVSDVFNTQGKTVLRFYNEESAPISVNRGYWHCKKFQLYPATISYGATTTQATVRADLMADVEAALKAWNANNYQAETVVAEDKGAEVEAAYNAVVNAYAAWSEVYADPTPMRDAVAAAKEFAKGIVEGKNPGQWPAGAGASVITTATDAAEAYNNAGAYTPAGVEEQIAAITAAKETVKGNAIQVVPGKWYAIRFATEEEYEANPGWDKNAAVSKEHGNLYGNYVAPAENLPAVLENEEVTVEAEHPIIENEDVRKGTELRFTEATPAVDNIAFRFVQLGDNLALQHASGWFVGTNGNLTNLPALFSTEAIGYGKSLIKVRNLAGEDVNNGGTPSYLHAQVNAHKLVAWAADAIDSRSALYIEEVDGNVTVGELVEEVRQGATHFLTSPLDLAYGANANVQLYDFKGYEKTATGVKVAFDKIEKAQAGKACLLVVDGDLSETPTAADTTEVTFTLDATHFAAQPDSTQALVGTYSYQWVEEEKMPSTITIYQNVMQMASGEDATECSRDIWAFEGAIDLLKAQAIENISGDLVLEIEGEFDTDAIQDVIANAVNTRGSIYTLDGRYVGKGNLGTVRNLGRGIYIVNGVKIAVK